MLLEHQRQRREEMRERAAAATTAERHRQQQQHLETDVYKLLRCLLGFIFLPPPQLVLDQLLFKPTYLLEWRIIFQSQLCMFVLFHELTN